MSTAQQQTAAPPPGWYPDPTGARQRRYWDGEDWTDGVARGDQVVEEPLPPEGAQAAWEERQDRRAALPLVALPLALAGMVAGVVAAAVLVGVGRAVDTDARWLHLLLGNVGLWSGVLGACVVVSKRYGTGSLVRDFGLSWRWRDAVLGPVLASAARLGALVVIVPLILIDRSFVNDDAGVLRLPDDGLTLLVVALLVVVGAPLIEEIFFRGLLQRVLECALPVGLALTGQALLFGLVHARPGLGLANVTVVIVTGLGGLVFGIAARRSHRLGPSIAAHSFFNLIPVALALAT
jgi:membrane protease YdiL (CAAX protease family)